MSPLKGIRLRSHEGENEGETDRCVLESGDRFVDIVRVFRPEKKIIGFLAASCLVLMSSRTASIDRERRRLTTGSVYLLFTVTITIVTSLSNSARGITARLCARKWAIRRPVWLHNRAFT